MARIGLLLFQSPLGSALSIAALAYALLSGLTPGLAFPALCSAGAVALGNALDGALLTQVLLVSSPERLLAGWMLMLVAMMAPLLVWPLAHVWKSSLPSRRVRAAGLFLLGYAGCWTVIGLIPLTAATVALHLIIADAAVMAIAGLAVALLWRASPWQQAALNRAHLLHRIGLFGFRADRDAFRYGLVHGWWCLASCWVLMLLPMLVNVGHVAAMMAVGAIALADRLRGPQKAAWRWSLPLIWMRS